MSIDKRKTNPIVVSVIFVVLAICVAGMIGNNVNNLVKKNDKLEKQVKQFESQFNDFQVKIITDFQIISAGISFDQKRKRLLLKLRDIIASENVKLSPVEAYEIAENNLEICDKYKSVDVILLTAIQEVESRFNTDAVSEKGAIGINQIWPSTGRFLCRFLGWEYDSKVLLDLEKNTQLACSYLDILHVTYDGEVALMLAEYNGGPRNAKYYREGNAKLSNETSQYIKKVLSAVDKYSKKMTEVL